MTGRVWHVDLQEWQQASSRRTKKRPRTLRIGFPRWQDVTGDSALLADS
jgi:hypothetical protein